MKSYLLFFYSALIAPIHIFAQYEFYVDPIQGNDNNTGTYIQRSFKSINKARDAIRNVNGNMSKNINVYLKGGTYVLDSAFILSTRDGGTNGFFIVYQPYNCEVPKISGGIEIKNWVLHDPQKGIYKASVSQPIQSRQLYVNGERAIRARSIDAAGWTENGDGYDCPETVSNWKNISNVEVVSYMVWKCHRGAIESVSNGHVKMSQPYWNNLHIQYSAPPVWIENAYELLDTEGEWYLDHLSKIIYYKPKVGEDIFNAEILLANEERLLNCSKVSNLEFRGITFAHATWLEPNSKSGYACLQADARLINENWEDFEQIPGNIFLEYCKNVNFVSCLFEHLGSTALQLSKGCKNNLIYNNTFTDISASAISIGSLRDSFPTAIDKVENNIIENNLISKVATEYQGSVGILVGYTNHTIITHNEIRNLPYTGISVGWGWSNTETVASENVVSYNLIDSVMTVLHDGGAIYTLSAQKGTQIHHNYIRNELNEHAALYADEGSSYMHFHNNVLSNVFRWINLWSITSLSDTVDFNYYDNASNIFSGTDCIAENNFYIKDGQWPLNAISIMNNAGRKSVEKCFFATQNLNGAVLKVYPNPGFGTIYLSVNLPQLLNYRVEVLDIQGKILQIINNNSRQFSINIENYPSGVYLIRAYLGRQIHNTKVVKL